MAARTGGSSQPGLPPDYGNPNMGNPADIATLQRISANAAQLPAGVKAALLNILTLGNSQHPGTVAPYFLNSIKSFNPMHKAGLVQLAAAVFGPRLDTEELQLGPINPQTGIRVPLVRPTQTFHERISNDLGKQLALDTLEGPAKAKYVARGQANSAAIRAQSAASNPNISGDAANTYADNHGVPDAGAPEFRTGLRTAARHPAMHAAPHQPTPQQLLLLRLLANRR